MQSREQAYLISNGGIRERNGSRGVFKKIFKSDKEESFYKNKKYPFPNSEKMGVNWCGKKRK